MAQSQGIRVFGRAFPARHRCGGFRNGIVFGGQSSRTALIHLFGLLPALNAILRRIEGYVGATRITWWEGSVSCRSVDHSRRVGQGGSSALRMGPMTTPDLSLCLVSFNARDVLQRCLESLTCMDESGVSTEIVVVDNASWDDSADLVAEEFPTVRLIRNQRNEGFSKAVNQAMAVSRGRFLGWLNTDTGNFPKAASALLEFLERRPKAGIVGPKILNFDGSFQPQAKRGDPKPLALLSYCLGLHRVFPSHPVCGQYLLSDLCPEQAHQVTAVSGSCLVARRTVLERIGGTDETIFAYGEDIDWCVRAREAGFEVWYNPEAVIVHAGGQGGSRTVPFRATYEFHRSMWLYYRKHLRSQYPWPVHAGVLTGITARLLWALVWNLIRHEKVIGSRKGRPVAEPTVEL